MSIPENEQSANDLPRCAHEQVEVRRRIVSNGAQHVVEQCLVCGCKVKDIAKAKWLGKINPKTLPEWDDSIAKDYWEGRRSEQMKAWQEQRQSESAEWWASYNVYLQSPQWKALRIKVLQRDKFTCQGCGRERSATQVHHLHYKRVGREMMFDLVSVCDACHAAIHSEEGE